ncbi:LysE family translocator [Roseovarius spongiae]|uniref:LysE family translocator n=1 Tax=Roseovarius spongiae TaxID=2320272 RepID=A0A3A8ATZ8_9RHOB|nr:LysE family transporter [Roseovarius spongiae]RKF15104.1 LysE family translocator [Roseovarius spongiae]
MLDVATVLLFNVAILGALVSPGPAFIVMIRSSFAGGRRAGLLTGLGLSVAAVAWSALALLGLEVAFRAVPAAYIVLKVLGACYLVWLAISLWRHADRPVESVPSGFGNGLRLGLITNLANPKLVFLIAAIFSTVVPAGLSVTAKLQLLANHLALELLWYAFAAFVLTTGPMRRAYVATKARFDRCAAVVLGALALRIAS